MLKFVPFTNYPFTGSPGSIVWVKRFGGTGTDGGFVTAVDGSGNSLVAGIFEGSVDFGGGALTSAGGYDIFLAKYSPSGAHLWSKRFGGANSEVPKCMALDASGNILLGGNFVGGCIMKLDSSGNLLWTKGPVATQNNTINVSSVVTDSAGNLFITGWFVALFANPMEFGDGHPLTSAAGSTDCFLAKYDPAGVCLNAKRFANYGGTEYGTGVKVRSDDTVILAGYTFSGIDLGGGNLANGNYGAYGFIGKFSNNLDYISARTTGTKGASDPSYAYARLEVMTLDANGDIIISGAWNYQADFGGGMRFGTAPNSLMYVAKYAGSDLHWMWDRQITGNLDIATSSMVADAQNNILLTGNFRGTYHFDGQPVANEFQLITTGLWDVKDCFVAKYNSGGTPVWAKKFGGTSDDAGNSVAVDASGNPVVTGYFTGTASFDGQTLVSAGGLDIFLMKLNP